jgi:hypothetical protein
MRVSRRQFLVSTGVVAATAGAGFFPGSLFAANQTVFYLDPEWGTGENCEPNPHLAGPDCHGCKACHGNANKLFTSAVLADSGRAHARCKCLIRSKAVSEAVFISYFGPPAGPKHRDEFDPRRDKLFLPEAAGPKATPTRTAPTAH